MRCLIGFVCGLLAVAGVQAKQSEVSDIWMVRQDFVKFGKKEVYEAAKKQYVQGLSQFERKRALFSSYAIQAIDSPQYLYLTPVGSYGGLDRLLKQQESFKNSFKPLDWEAMMGAENSAMNFLFNNLQKFLPAASYVPKGKENFFSLPYVYVYWIQIAPGQSSAFEDHLERLVKQQEGVPNCWRVWKGTFGHTLPQYFIVVFAATEKEAEERASQIDFIFGPVKQIVRKLREDRGVLRLDLSLNVS